MHKNTTIMHGCYKRIGNTKYYLPWSRTWTSWQVSILRINHRRDSNVQHRNTSKSGSCNISATIAHYHARGRIALLARKSSSSCWRHWPVAVYGGESWTLKASDKFQMTMLRLWYHWSQHLTCSSFILVWHSRCCSQMVQVLLIISLLSC